MLTVLYLRAISADRGESPTRSQLQDPPRLHRPASACPAVRLPHLEAGTRTA